MSRRSLLNRRPSPPGPQRQRPWRWAPPASFPLRSPSTPGSLSGRVELRRSASEVSSCTAHSSCTVRDRPLSLARCCPTPSLPSAQTERASPQG
eukprot:scaffold207002_cov30-Tisochrysis_lutea.AAC.1